MRRLGLLLLLAACDAPPPAILSTTVPGDTRDVVGPYTVQVVTRDVAGGDTVVVRYSTDGVAFVTVEARTRSGRGDLHHGDIPGQPRGTRIAVYTAVLRDGLEVATDYPLDLVGFSFAILGLDACRADSDCAASEICAGERCVPYGGACVEGECRDGYVCEADACVIAVLACGSDEGCPSTEECDLERRECRPRRPCSDALPCPDDQICRPDLALCFPP